MTHNNNNNNKVHADNGIRVARGYGYALMATAPFWILLILSWIMGLFK